MNIKKLRLGPLLKAESVKLTFVYPVSLKVDLDRHAALHTHAYGETVDAVKLISHMLEEFMGVGSRGQEENLLILRLQAFFDDQK